MEDPGSDELALSAIAEENSTEASSAPQVEKYSTKILINLSTNQICGVLANEKGAVRITSEVSSEVEVQELLDATIVRFLGVLVVSSNPVLPNAVEVNHQEQSDGSKRAVIKRRLTRAVVQQNRNTSGAPTPETRITAKRTKKLDTTTSRKAAMGAASLRPGNITDEGFENREPRTPEHETSETTEVEMTTQDVVTKDPDVYENASPNVTTI
jgi:hypothetical protein